MPPIRSLASVCYILLATSISLNSKIMSPYSYYAKKGLVYITITVFSNCQPSFYIKCTKLNMCLSCNIKSVSNAECIFVFLYNIYSLSQLLGGNTQ